MRLLKLISIASMFTGAIITTRAQGIEFAKGTKSINGSATIGYLNSEIGTSLFQVGLSPTYGGFVNKNLFFEGSASLNFINFDGGNVTIAFLSPSLRYYFNPEAKCRFFSGVTGLFGIISANSGGRASAETNSIYGGGVSVGFDYFLSRNIALEPSLNYTYLTSSDNIVDATSNLTLDARLRSFFSTSDVKMEEAGGLTDKGRTSVQGALTVNIEDGVVFNINAGASRFLVKNFLVGAQLGYSSDDPRPSLNTLINAFNFPIDLFSNAVPLSGSLSARGYLPIGKKQRTFLTAQGILTGLTNFEEAKGLFNVNLGASYFLTKDIALDARVLSYTFGGDLGGSFFGGIGVGLQYFIK